MMGRRAREGRGAVLSVVVCWVTDMKDPCEEEVEEEEEEEE
jgi:hypothetical protein